MFVVSVVASAEAASVLNSVELSAGVASELVDSAVVSIEGVSELLELSLREVDELSEFCVFSEAVSVYVELLSFIGYSVSF